MTEPMLVCVFQTDIPGYPVVVIVAPTVEAAKSILADIVKTSGIAFDVLVKLVSFIDTDKPSATIVRADE